MKVIQLITRLIVGGAQRLAIEQADHVRSLGADSALWFGPQTGPEGSLAEEARARGIAVRVFDDLVKEVSPARDARASRAIEAALRRAQPDVFHTHSSKAGILGRVAARRARVPAIVHTIHGWGWHEGSAPLARAAFVRAERFAAARCDRLIAVSTSVRDEGLRRRIGAPERYVVLPPGIDTRPFADLNSLQARGARLRAGLGFPTGRVLAGFVGRLSPQKNPSMLIDLLPRVPEIDLLLVGDGPLRANLERRAAALGVTGRIRFAGLQDATAPWYAAIDVFLLTSLWEGLPLTCIEACAAARPVVAPAVAGIPEVVPPAPAGRTYPPGDAQGLEEAVRGTLADLPAASEAALAWRDRVLVTHARQSMLARLVEIYASLAPPGSPGKGLPTRSGNP